MVKEYIYKLQGDGRDSWTCIERDNEGVEVNRYMVYEDPFIKPIPNVDVVGLLQSLSSEELDKIRQILNNL